MYVCMIYKKESERKYGDARDNKVRCENYRGIFLVDVIYKIFIKYRNTIPRNMRRRDAS